MKPLDLLKLSGYRLRFRWLNKKTYGLIDFQRETITINLELFVTATAVHELAHLEKPDLSERKIIKLERARVNRMTTKDIRTLARKLLKGGGYG